MKFKSKVTGKSYEPSNVIYIANLQQLTAYMANGADEFIVDFFYDRSRKDHKLVFALEKNDFTRNLYKQWNEYKLKID